VIAVLYRPPAMRPTITRRAATLERLSPCQPACDVLQHSSVAVGNPRDPGRGVRNRTRTTEAAMSEPRPASAFPLRVRVAPCV
jgi:hypothetical protein